MTGRITCRVAHGRAIFAASAYDFRVYRVRQQWTRDSAATSGVKRPGLATSQNIGPHGAINGTIYGDTVEHDPGTFILLTSSRTRGQSPVEDGAVILRLRPSAARIVVQGCLPSMQDNHFGDYVTMFEGNADILSVDEAELHGLRVPRGFVQRFFDPEQVNARFVVTELVAEVADKPQFAAVATATGVEVMQVPAAPSRRIRIRR